MEVVVEITGADVQIIRDDGGRDVGFAEIVEQAQAGLKDSLWRSALWLDSHEPARSTLFRSDWRG
jgi:hypothetical protein